MPKIDGSYLIDTVVVARDVSEDRQAASILFDNLSVSIGWGEGSNPQKVKSQFIDTKVASLSIPIIENDEETSLKLDVRGYIDVAPAARATLVIQTGEKTNVFNFTNLNLENEFVKSIDYVISPQKNCQLTFFLLVEKDSQELPGVGANLVIEALEIFLD